MGLDLKICVTLAVLCFMGHNVLGAPTKGRYMWVRCKPNDKKANCVTEKGPWMDLPGPDSRLPPSAAKDIVPIETPEEQSGEGSGDGNSILALPELGSGGQWMGDSHELGVHRSEEGSGGLGEEGSTEIDYSDFVFPTNVQLPPNLPPMQDLKDEHLIM